MSADAFLYRLLSARAGEENLPNTGDRARLLFAPVPTRACPANA
jgi:hypothetical protein